MKKRDLAEQRLRVARIIKEFREEGKKFAQEPSTILAEAEGMVIETANISKLIKELREEDDTSSPT